MTPCSCPVAALLSVERALVGRSVLSHSTKLPRYISAFREDGVSLRDPDVDLVRRGRVRGMMVSAAELNGSFGEVISIH